MLHGGGDLDPRPDETLDLLFGERVALIQARRGYRTSVDALVLAWAGVPLVEADAPIVGLDLGCGVGLVGILAALALPSSHWTFIDLQPQQIERAGRNARRNGVADRCTLVLADVAALPPAGPFDLVLCNPPFRPAMTHAPSANRERQLSNFESTANLERMVSVALAALAPTGRAVFIYPWAGRARLLAAMANADGPTTWCAVRHQATTPPVRVVAVAGRDANVTLDGCLPSDLHLHPVDRPDSEHSAEITHFCERLGPALAQRGR